MLDYALLASFVLYFVVLRLLANAIVGPVSGAAIVAIGSFVVSAIPQAILSGSLAGAFSWQSILTIILQMIVATVIFYKLHQHEDSLTGWFALTLFGALLLFVAVPALAMYLVWHGPLVIL